MATITWNPNDKYQNMILSNSNLTVTSPSSTTTYGGVRATEGKNKGKWYWEITLDKSGIGGGSYCTIGICNNSQLLNGFSSKDGYRHVRGMYDNGYKVAPYDIYGKSFTTNSIISVLLDMNNGKIEFWVDGASQGIAFTNLSGDTWFPCVFGWTSYIFTANFGATPFKYNPPSEYLKYNSSSKYILKQDNQYYAIKSDLYKDGKFTPIILNGGITPNKLDFDTYGIDNLSVLTNSMTVNTETFKPISKFTKIKIISGTDDITAKNIENQIILVPQGRLVIPKNPRLLPTNIQKLNKLTVTSNITGSSIVKYAVSFDGKQYKIWNGLAWENIDLTLDDVKNKGMSIPTINSITTWEQIRGTSTKIWLVKYIEQDLPCNKCEIDKEEINFDENGYWRSLNVTEQSTHPITYGKNENNLFDSATVTNNSGASENLMITSLSFVTTTDTKFKTFSVVGSNDLVSSVENGTLTFNSKNKTIKMVSDDTTDTIDFDVDINTLPTF